MLGGFWVLSTLIFLSTLSLRRATFSAGRESDTEENFYPRSPCGERPHCYQQATYFFYFYPRSPCGERLKIIFLLSCPFKISIHALLAESDGEGE